MKEYHFPLSFLLKKLLCNIQVSIYLLHLQQYLFILAN